MIKFKTQDNVLFDDLYYKLYFNYNIISRPSCEKCKFSDIHGNTDLTIGDFWGIEKFHGDFDDGKGISLILAHTEKGKGLINDIKHDIIIEESKEEYCIKENPRLISPTKFGIQRSKFFEDYIRYGYKYVLKNYLCVSIMVRAKMKLLKYIKGSGKHV